LSSLEIWCWDFASGINLGHVALGFGGVVFGIFNREPYKEYNIGYMKMETEKVLAEEWFKKFLSRPKCSVSEDGSSTDPPCEAYKYLATVSEHDYIEMLLWCIRWYLDPGRYSIKSQNCVTEVIKLFKELGVYEFELTYKPTQFRKELVSLVNVDTGKLFRIESEILVEACRDQKGDYYWIKKKSE